MTELEWREPDAPFSLQQSLSYKALTSYKPLSKAATEALFFLRLRKE
jgi:hypothetical protein